MQFYNITDNLQTQFVLGAIAASSKVNLTGFTNEMVILTPPNVTPVPMLPKKEKEFYTDDARYAQMLADSGFAVTPVQQVAGAHIQPQPPQVASGVRSKLIWSKVLIALLATVAAAGLGLLAMYLMLVVARQEGGLAVLVVLMVTFVPWTSIFFGGGQAVEKRIIAPYKLPDRVRYS